MAKLSDDALLRTAIDDAILDRDTFSDAYSRAGPESDEAVDLIAKMRALNGKVLRSMTPEELEVARLTFLYAEQWRESLASAQAKTSEIDFSKRRLNLFREVRLRRWGSGTLERLIATGVMEPVDTILARIRKMR